jgi:hypothetical protein
MKADTIVIVIPTPPMTPASESSGLRKLETWPGGGLASGTCERSNPAGIDIVVDELLSECNVKVRAW